MTEKIFMAKNLTKKYRSSYVLDGLDMNIYRGSIYGFVGRNGAGKTTLMRILAGRARQTGGGIELFGMGDEEEISVQRGRIGAMIETPALYAGMSAHDNLKVLRLQKGIRGTDGIEEALEMVGLSDAGSKKVRTFSLGMKQRLGLAMALVGNPEFLVLDEPVNGLDPEGIIDFREIIQRLNHEHGVTVLISSHLLSELDSLATCYGFIRNGKMIEEISAEDLRDKYNEDIEEHYLSLMRGGGG